MQFDETVTARRSVKSYDRGHKITDDELKAIFEKVILSPSSFNLQHWRFVVVRDPARKAEIRQAAWNQEQIETASAVIVVCAKLDAHQDAERLYADTPKSVRDRMVPMIHGFYADKPQMQRDEAIRSASLAAMTLMFAATDIGYATGPMIGFDPIAVTSIAGLDDQHIPVMLVVIGKQTGDIRPRATRLPLAQIVRLESFTGPGLD